MDRVTKVDGRGAPGVVSPAGRANSKAGSVNRRRLRLVLLIAALYLLGGAGLGAYCFVRNKQASPAPSVAGSNVLPSAAESGSPTTTPALPGVAPALSTTDQKAINDAILKGVWFLKNSQRDNGSWDAKLPVAYAALAGLTLLECGVLATDPVVQNCAKCVRDRAAQVANNVDNYQRSLAILFLDRLNEGKDKDLIQYLALCLMAGQHPTDGGWSYSAPVLDRALVGQLIQQLKDPRPSLEDWRQVALKGEEFTVTTWDNSNTQFAILGLWAARRHDVPIERSIALVEKHFRNTQLHGQGGAALGDPAGHNLDLDGSWYYAKQGTSGFRNSSMWPSMTAAGLLGLAMAHGVTTDTKEHKEKPLDDPAIKQGLAMLAREIDRKQESRPLDYYFLWSLERVGVLYNLPKINDKDWYAWGIRLLLPRQQENGSWRNGAYYGNNPTLDTCFVLLFLKRANLVQDLTIKLQLLGESK